MKLDITNFAKIREANIIVDGITVIAGENNTGKSTVGKILFSLFNALSDIDNKITDERLKEMELSNRVILQNHSGETDIPRHILTRNQYTIAKKINMNVQKELQDYQILTEDNIEGIVLEEVRIISNAFNKNEYIKQIVSELTKNINEILSLSEKTIVLEVISSYFNNVFAGQINSVSKESNDKAILGLEIKGKKNEITFYKNSCINYNEDVSIRHKALYIDNPFIIDELSKYNDLNPMNEVLKNLLTNISKEDVMDGIIEKVRVKEKLNDIFKTLNCIVDGEVIVGKNNDEYFLKMSDYSEPISFNNLSTGIKSFMILKMLLENGCLKEKDVVILDEPEIHLHPQWQIAYAELIVLLQKHFDLSVVVTTHSPYFVDAINLFSVKYGTDSKTNYYLSSNDENMVKIECVTEKIESIYEKMTSPIQELETLRYELNNKEGMI